MSYQPKRTESSGPCWAARLGSNFVFIPPSLVLERCVYVCVVYVAQIPCWNYLIFCVDWSRNLPAPESRLANRKEEERRLSEGRGVGGSASFSCYSQLAMYFSLLIPSLFDTPIIKSPRFPSPAPVPLLVPFFFLFKWVHVELLPFLFFFSFIPFHSIFF